MDRRPDPYQLRARELCLAAGIDPDSRVAKDGSERGMPAWCQFRQAAVDEQYGPRVAPRSEGPLFHLLIEAENDLEAANVAKVIETFIELMKTPVLKAGAVMPDACPAGRLGEIPVGGVVSSTDIHPGMHSADICCSMAISVLGRDVSPGDVMDAGMRISHFGPGGRDFSYRMQCPDSLLAEFEGNPFLSMSIDAAKKHFATQGDGNHFFYVGRLKSTGEVAIVTHHGSRKPGAILYKNGLDTAERYRRKISPETLPWNAWIPSNTIDGENYWKALQIIRRWTKKNHFAIHDGVAAMLGVKVVDRFWNEHNFVFQKTDGLFYHGKGATPAWQFFAGDSADGLTLIPMNMAEPILIVTGTDNVDALGFSPHGAGRNMSRTAHLASLGDRDRREHLLNETAGLDVRFYCGAPDLSELPGAYKSAASVRAQIDKFRLADVVDEVLPYGCIMAGDAQSAWRQRNQPKEPNDE